MKNIFPSVVRKVFVGLGAVVILGFVAWSSAGGIKTTHAAAPCIITVFGVQYDVTPLQTSHTGGNVFVCGTDMTTLYQAQHGINVDRLIPYLITTPTPSPIPSVTPTPSVEPSITPSPSVTPSVSPTPSVEIENDSDNVNENQEEMHENELAEIHENTETDNEEENDRTRNEKDNQNAQIEIRQNIAVRHDD